ncbi:translation initiation factor IF-2-like [Pteropus medius]|uniref:translation initiation factor IF-2-like n=1 Tax=Pteropus vampyrus TaxID=132908 RepID=UPI00196A8985|nr:translation initiation factor IF-2-like [Pteropus giganteus]
MGGGLPAYAMSAGRGSASRAVRSTDAGLPAPGSGAAVVAAARVGRRRRSGGQGGRRSLPRSAAAAAAPASPGGGAGRGRSRAQPGLLRRRLWERRGPVGGAASACGQAGPEGGLGLKEGRGRPRAPDPQRGGRARLRGCARLRRGEKLPGTAGGAAVGSGMRVTWSLGRRAHVSVCGGEDRSGRRSAVPREEGCTGSPRALGLGAGWRSGNFDMIRSDAVPGKKLSPVILENHAGGAGGGVLLQSVRRNWACEMDRPCQDTYHF